MTDPHHIPALIASSITECSKHNPSWVVHAEEAKVMAKCILSNFAMQDTTSLQLALKQTVRSVTLDVDCLAAVSQELLLERLLRRLALFDIVVHEHGLRWQSNP